MWCDHTLKKRSKPIKRDSRGARGLDKTRSMAGKQYRVSLHKIDVPKTHCQLRYLYTIDGRWRLYWRRGEKIPFQKSRIDWQNLRKTKQNFYEKFSRGQDSQLFNRNWCKESFLTVYLKMLVAKIENKKWNTAGTKKKLSRVMYIWKYQIGTIQYLSNIWFI